MRYRPVISLAFVLILAITTAVPLDAAPTFAAPGFGQQWNGGEALAPNFWGPIATARDGQNEPYKEGSLGFSESGPTNPGQGMRLVQYFDKARMELSHPAQGLVTNGLLARELILGRVQTGDDTFEVRSPAAIPIAGDLDNVGPTYAAINGSSLMAPTASTETMQASLSLSANGTVGTYAGPYLNDPYAVISHPEATTHHNVPKAFCDFRARVGLASIGYAISEPFWSSVKVGGQQKDVLIQAYERRVLTYTPSNPDAYKIEFGNIGQHYYRWRYNTP